MLVRTLRALVEELGELIAPLRCASCDLELGAAWQGREDGFCAGCAAVLERAPPHLSLGGTVAALFTYGGPVEAALKRLKYSARLDVSTSLARVLRRVGGAYHGSVDAVVPVPLHPRRLRERGFNQAHLLARHVASGARVSVRPWLERARDTPPQVGRSLAERRANVRGAFRARTQAAGQRILLVDDVRTTGATLAAATEALIEAGARDVRALTFAYAERVDGASPDKAV